MVYRCCCGCSCVGCAQVTLSGIIPDTPAGEPYDTYWTAAYNRTFTMWKSSKGTRTPFDGLATCTAEDEGYPGTLCVIVADACCAANADDPVDEGGGPTVEIP